MVGDPSEDVQARRRGAAGHRAVPHTADVRIEAWGPSREQCLVEAARGMVGWFADVSGARPAAVHRLHLADTGDADTLAALLDEVVYRLEVYGEVPVEVEARPAAGGGLDVRLGVTGLDAVPRTGSAPKGVSWNELRLAPGPYGWSCAATIDV
ncbi:archease [Streptomyces sp. JJ36]|uniref:archease n=1 Tax=Streptomyces sp. JJ36 TaxID=2736645 RepID=UPI001F280A4B|nr:archease [Streptomyces sp. JJ36]MCF6525460.1 archease [Streptomyces sp. JJ36]